MAQIQVKKLPSEKKKYEFVGWGRVKQLALVREILGSGFALHFAQNELLLDIFEVTKEEPESAKTDKKLDKAMRQKAMRQEKEKTSALEKGKQRKKKNAFQEDLFHDE